MSILSIAQDVSDEVRLPRPSALIGASDPNVRGFLAAAKSAGQDMLRAHQWSVLHREHEITTVADQDNYAVPDDWGRPISDTAWDRSTFWRMRGAVTPQQWQFLRSGLASNPALRRRFRVLVGPLAGSILIDPVPTSAGSELVIEYVSRFWVESAAGTGQATITADTDEIRLDHDTFRLGMLWRSKKDLGLAYADDRADYERALYAAKVADLAMGKVCLTDQMGDDRYSRAGAPEGNWGL